MALYNVVDADNGLKVGDIITAYHKGYWIVTSIDKRATDYTDVRSGHDTVEGLLKNSIINYELVFDSNFKPAGKKKRKGRCDSSYCRKVDDEFFIEKVKEMNAQMDAFCSLMQSIKALGKMKQAPMNIMSLGGFQSMFVAQQVGRWLDIGGNTRSGADATHSSLLQRLLTGVEPLPNPPPVRMSYPWYELGEGKKIELDPEFDNEVTINGTQVSFGNSGPFKWVDQKAGIIVYPYSGEHFRVWKEDKKKFIQKIE